MLSDQQLVPGFKGAMTLAANVGMEPKGRKPSEDVGKIRDDRVIRHISHYISHC